MIGTVLFHPRKLAKELRVTLGSVSLDAEKKSWLVFGTEYFADEIYTLLQKKSATSELTESLSPRDSTRDIDLGHLSEEIRDNLSEMLAPHWEL